MRRLEQSLARYAEVDHDVEPSRTSARHRRRLHGGPAAFAKVVHLLRRVSTLLADLAARSLALRLILAGCPCAAGGYLLYAAAASFTGVHLVWLALTLAYAYITETVRLRKCREDNAALQSKCRKLVQARRAAGLLRLEQDTSQRRLGHWPTPPHSGAKAFLYGSGAEGSGLIGGAGALDTRQMDYRALSIGLTAEFLSFGRQQHAIATAEARRAWHAAVFRQLSQAGPEPVRDAELYRDMHAALDEVEQSWQRAHGHGQGSAHTHTHGAGAVSGGAAGASALSFGGGVAASPSQRPGPQGFYCRLCLGYQRSNDPVKLKCGHCMCRSCAVSLVGSAISGSVGVPVSCPVGW